MPKRRFRIHIKKHDNEKKFVRTLKQSLILLFVFLSAVILTLVFRLGQGLWPIWIVDYRIQIAGIIIFVLLFLIILSPAIIEFEVNPKFFSGPGHRPY